jgi:four helix bundle protein
MKEAVEAMRKRTTAYALGIVRMYAALPKTAIANVLGNQALRSGTSVGAQYREACRARSDAEVISKLESVLQELDETDYWLGLLVESETIERDRLEGLIKETDEITAMLVTSVKRIKDRRKPT